MSDGIDYSVLDRPEILQVLFHPRREMAAPAGLGTEDLMIPVEDGVAVGARCHMADTHSPTVLFFHGNGEIAADYDDLGPLFNRRTGVNFIVADYRGYGRSDGSPTVSSMMADCHRILEYVENDLKEKGYDGPLIAMGRSLGSASALDLAARRSASVSGLIVESGFAHAGPLLRLLGARPEVLGFNEEQGFSHLEKIRSFTGPTLVIHAEYDHIIPYSDGKALAAASGDPERTFLTIPGANHNDIFFQGMEPYLEAVERLAERCR